MPKLIYDASIRKWRKRTVADIKWAADVVDAVKKMEGKGEKR